MIIIDNVAIINNMYIRPFLYKGVIYWIPSVSGGWNADLEDYYVS